MQVWLGILVEIMVEHASEFGALLGFSPGILGLTLLAGGTSFPDLVASLIVAKQGQVSTTACSPASRWVAFSHRPFPCCLHRRSTWPCRTPSARTTSTCCSASACRGSSRRASSSAGEGPNASSG